MVVTRSSTRSHGVPKDSIKTSIIAREDVNSSWRPDTRTTRQTRPDAAAREARPQSPPPVRYTPARRASKRQPDAKSVVSIATHVSENSEIYEGPEDDEEPQNDEATEAGDVEEEAGLGLVKISEVERSGSRSSRLGDAALNPDIMIRMRGHLYKATQDLYNHLCSTRRDDTWDSLLDCFRNIFSQWKAHYTTHKTPFLDRELISDALGQQPQDASAVSHVVSAANLVTLMDSIHQVGGQVGGALDIFRKIDDDFPGCIMAPESARAEAYEKYDTFDRALDIRISLWIFEIVTNGALTEEAAMGIGSTLLFDTPPEDVIYPTEIDWESIEFRSIYGDYFEDHENEGPEKHEMRKEIFRAFKGVSELITDPGFDIRKLEKNYPLDECLDDVFQWAKNLFGEVVDTIEKESARPATNPPATKLPAPNTPGDARRRPSGQSLHIGRSSVQFLASAKKKRPAPATETDTGSRKTSRGEDASEYSGAPSEDSEGEDRARSSNESDRSEIADEDIHGSRGASGEENKARRQISRPPASPHRKKPITRRPREPRAQGHESTSADGAPRASGQRESPPATSRSTASEDRGPPPSSAATTRRPQRRAFWEKEDERTLRDLVSLHGSYWSLMEKKAREEDSFLIPRTQQQMRDKARNMKVDFLKDDMLLPHGFDDVVLGKKERVRLIGLGKNPERTETDVQDGRPVNTEWTGEEE